MMKPMSQFFGVRQHAQLLGSDSFPSEIVSEIPWLDRRKDAGIVVVILWWYCELQNCKKREVCFLEMNCRDTTEIMECK